MLFSNKIWQHNPNIIHTQMTLIDLTQCPLPKHVALLCVVIKHQCIRSIKSDLERTNAKRRVGTLGVMGSWIVVLHKVSRRYFITFSESNTCIWLTSVLIRWRSKNKHHKDTCLEDTTSANSINHSTLNSEQNWGKKKKKKKLCIHLRNQQTCTYDDHKNFAGRFDFPLIFSHASSSIFSPKTSVVVWIYSVEVGGHEEQTN